MLAGGALAAWGTAACFGLNGLSFVIVIVALASLNVKHVPPATRQGMKEELRDGLSYARRQPALMALAALAFLTAFLGLPLLTFLPVVAKEIFQRDVGGYSEMLAWSGAGAVSGALVVAWLGRFRHMGRTLLVVQIAFGLLVVAFAVSRLAVDERAAAFPGERRAHRHVLAHELARAAQRRGPSPRTVMGIYMVAFRGGMPLGSLAAGYAATFVPTPWVLATNGGLIVIVAAYFLASRSHGISDL